jgi:thiamine-phosphate pyrophosphorylase
MPFAPQGLEKIGDWRKRVGDLLLVAIGGLTPERAIQALEAGATSVAVVTDISLNAEPERRAREWREATERWRNTKK